MSDDNPASLAPAQPLEEEDEITPVLPPQTAGALPPLPPPIVLDSSAHTFTLPPYPIPGTSVDLPRVEGTLLFPPLPELNLPPHPLDQGDFPVMLSGTPAATMPAPITPTFPIPPAAIPSDSISFGFLSPFRQMSPMRSLDQHIPSIRQTYLFSAPQDQPEEPAVSMTATPFQRYLRNPHLHERSATDSPTFNRGGTLLESDELDQLMPLPSPNRGWSGDEITGSSRSFREMEEFDHNEYLNLGSDLPEETLFPDNAQVQQEVQITVQEQIQQDRTPSHVDMVTAFQNHMHDKGNKDDRESMELLIRHAIPVLGVKTFLIRCLLHSWYKDWIRTHGSVPTAKQKEFAFLLIESDVYEDKLAAVLFMQEILIAKKSISNLDMPRFEAMFRSGHIKVYKVCDHFSDKVLCYLLRQGSQEMVDTLFTWARADDLWQARAALSALSNHAGNKLLHERLLEAVKHMMSRPEEEAKSMAGTALRSISDIDSATVMAFLNISENIGNTSVNALEKATSRLSKEQKKYFRTLRRDVKSTEN